jgi:hypothetical protein
MKYGSVSLNVAADTPTKVFLPPGRKRIRLRGEVQVGPRSAALTVQVGPDKGFPRSSSLIRRVVEKTLDEPLVNNLQVTPGGGAEDVGEANVLSWISAGEMDTPGGSPTAILTVGGQVYAIPFLPNAGGNGQAVAPGVEFVGAGTITVTDMTSLEVSVLSERFMIVVDVDSFITDRDHVWVQFDRAISDTISLEWEAI